MYPTRDSMVWIVTFIGSMIGYLISVKTPPTQWDYNQWLQVMFAALGIISAKFQGSPLQLSFKGQEKAARGEAVFVEMPKTSPGDSPKLPPPPAAYGGDWGP